MDNCGLPIPDIQNNGFGESSRERQQDAIVPKQGLVNQVCREWLVHEDGALAYRLQEKEIEMHYGKNREQRKTIQMDFRQAKYLQEEDDDDDTNVPLSEHDVELLRQELEDERVAKELQEQIEREEALHNRILEQADKELAKKLQDCEARQNHRRRNKSEESHESSRSKELAHSSKKDLATCYEDTLSRATRNWSLENVTADGVPNTSSISSLTSSPNGTSPILDVEREMKAHGFQSTILSKSLSLPRPEEMRRLQEVKDEELALSIQDEEATKTSQYYKDQQLAIEAQDRELAKLLQEKERLRAKKAKQKARAAAQQKSMSVDGCDEASRSEIAEPDKREKKPQPKRTQNYFHHRDVMPHQSGAEASGSSKHGSHTRSSTSPLFTRSQSHDDREQFPSASRNLGLERLPIATARGRDMPNVAMALDPTYYHEYNTIEQKSPDLISPLPIQPSGSHQRSPQRHVDISDEEYGSDDDLSAPPYMPIQGQKRQTIDKRKKKDSCKQQ